MSPPVPKQVQPALYNGHVLVKSNHAPPVVHDSEDTREIAEITRKRMLENEKALKCVENKLGLPPDYSKENLLATFAPQRNLTPEQIFWSKITIRKMAETLAPKQFRSFDVYHPILLSSFVTRNSSNLMSRSYRGGKRFFEQTKRCSLTEVIPFSKLLKKHFVGVQTALLREVKCEGQSRVPYNAIDVTALVEQNDCYRVELEKVKQHYKELYDSIKSARVHTSEKTSTMLNEIESLKAQLRSKEPCFTVGLCQPKVLVHGCYD
ncbi:hypothetical protein Tco_0461039 [Tanacetum coccineum]